MMNFGNTIQIRTKWLNKTDHAMPAYYRTLSHPLLVTDTGSFNQISNEENIFFKLIDTYRAFAVVDSNIKAISMTSSITSISIHAFHLLLLCSR